MEKTLESSGDETKRGSATLASVSAALNRANADLEAERRRREEARRVSRDLETLAALETSRADAAERDAEARAKALAGTPERDAAAEALRRCASLDEGLARATALAERSRALATDREAEAAATRARARRTPSGRRRRPSPTSASD